MKILVILLFVPFLSHAMVPPLSCEQAPVDASRNSPEQLKSYYCELNLRCTVNALNSTAINWDEVDSRRGYSIDNNCNDELKLAALMAEMAKDPPELHAKVGPHVNQSERSSGKDLPAIPDAPSAGTATRVRGE